MRIKALVIAVGIAVATGAAAPPASASSAPTGSVQKAFGALGPLTDLLIERLWLGDQVAAAKFGTGRPIDDPARERQLLDQARADALALGIDPAAAVRVFQDQIAASKVVQRGLFARWTAHPDEAPTVRPDLAALRTDLDRITGAILRQLAETTALRSDVLPCRIDVNVATQSGATLQRLDRLHRQALAVAQSSVCSADIAQPRGAA